jgi:hypothetical protein
MLPIILTLLALACPPAPIQLTLAPTPPFDDYDGKYAWVWVTGILGLLLLMAFCCCCLCIIERKKRWRILEIRQPLLQEERTIVQTTVAPPADRFVLAPVPLSKKKRLSKGLLLHESPRQ